MALLCGLLLLMACPLAILAQDSQGVRSTSSDKALQSIASLQTRQPSERPRSTDISSKADALPSRTPSRAQEATRAPTRTKTPEVPTDAAAAAISMMTPKVPLATPLYYKVGNPIELAWNYSNVYITPASVDIEAYCALNQHHYPIALNASYEQVTKVIWDTGAYQDTAAVPLLTAQYTLVVRDTGAAETQAVTPIGKLGVVRPYVFGMYLTQAYRDSDLNSLAECSLCFQGAAATSNRMERRTLILMSSMVTVVALSVAV